MTRHWPIEKHFANTILLVRSLESAARISLYNRLQTPANSERIYRSK